MTDGREGRIGRPGQRGLAERLGGAVNPRFSICVMLTHWDEYHTCMDSFRRGGFDDESTEFIVIDNSRGNRADGYTAVNEFLQSAVGRYIIICHQDVLLLDDGRTVLEERLAELDRIDPAWAICGNAGYTADGWPVLCLSHPRQEIEIVGEPFPVPVVSLDENFLVIRRAANLAVSRDLDGYHHYGVDLCIIADVLGWNAYVIGFFLRHNSGGTLDASYDRSRERIAAKYRRAFRPRWAHVITVRPFLLSGWSAHHRVAGLQRRLGKLFGRYPRDRDLGRPERRPPRPPVSP